MYYEFFDKLSWYSQKFNSHAARNKKNNDFGAYFTVSDRASSQFLPMNDMNWLATMAQWTYFAISLHINSLAYYFNIFIISAALQIIRSVKRIYTHTNDQQHLS